MPDGAAGNYRCPACKSRVSVGQPAPLPVAVEVEEVEGMDFGEPPVRVRAKRRRPRGASNWRLCGLLTLLVFLAHLALFFAADSAVQQAAVSAEASTLIIALYVLARCHEKTLPRDD
jgi:hypothetical protein